MIDAIANDFVKIGFMEDEVIGKRDFAQQLYLDKAILGKRAEEIAKERKYPAALANRTVPKG